MPVLTNLSCITDLIDIRNSCETQTGVVYWTDDEGVSLATSAALADERYVTGQNLVNQKKRIALNKVYKHLTKNLHPDCDFDKATGILCDRADDIAEAVFYKTVALLYYEQVAGSSKYNEYIQFAGSEALAKLLYYDSSYRGFTNAENVPSGLYQKELDNLETIRHYIESSCCTECKGTRWTITIP